MGLGHSNYHRCSGGFSLRGPGRGDPIRSGAMNPPEHDGLLSDRVVRVARHAEIVHYGHTGSSKINKKSIGLSLTLAIAVGNVMAYQKEPVMAKRNRSPNYPAISLKVSMDYLDKLYAHANRHWVPVSSAIQEAWGFAEGSTHGNQIVAAIKSFGLIDTQGSGDKRQLRITDSGAKIQLGHSDRPNLLKAAALSPTVHGEVWEVYKESGSLPPDATLRQYLMFDRPGAAFTDNAVGAFIDEIKETFGFAGVIGDGIMADEEDDPDSEHEGHHAGNPPSEWEIGRKPKLPAAGAGMTQATFPLDEGQAVVQWPEKLSKDSYDTLKDWIELVLRKAERSIVSDEPPAPEND